MKKRISLIITLILSLFVFSDRVEAGTVMYYECDYDSYEEVNFNMVLRATHSKGTDHLFGGYGKIYHVQADQMIEGLWMTHQVEDYCWIGTSSSISDACSIGSNAKATVFKMNNQICPASIRYNDNWVIGELFGGTRLRFKDGYLLDLIFAGNKEPKANSVSIIDEDEYIVYKIYSDIDNKEIFVFEAYSANTGQYFYINRNFNKEEFNFLGFSAVEEIDRYQLKSAYENGGNFWRVSNNFNALYPYVSGYCSSLEDCVNNKHYVEILSSRDNDTKISNYINDWYLQEGNKYTVINEFDVLINDDKFMSTCNNLISSYENGISYSFSDGYDATQFLYKLEQAYSLLWDAYEIKPYYKNYLTGEEEQVDVYSSAMTYIYSEVFGVDEFEDLLIKKDDSYYILNESNGGDHIIETMINDDIKIGVNNIFSKYDSEGVNKIELFERLDEYNELFAKTISYFEVISTNEYLTQANRDKLKILSDNMSNLAREHEIFIIVSCEDLISDELNEKILSYFNIIRIAVPILLVGFGIIDFTKAIFLNDDSEIKKAQSKFIKRIFIAIIFFFVPVFVNLLLSLANQVWDIINPNSCIRF